MPKVKIIHNGVENHVVFNVANFPKFGASIGINAKHSSTKSVLCATFAFCNRKADKFSRAQAMKVIAHRIVGKKSKSLYSMPIASLPHDEVEAFLKRAFTIFGDAAAQGTKEYDQAKVSGYPLPSRADLIIDKFRKAVKDVKFQTTKKEKQLA